MKENIDAWAATANGLIGLAIAIIGFYAFLSLRKLTLKKDESELIKTTKENDVAGDAAVVEQIDFLLLKIAGLTRNVYEIQVDKSKYQNRDLSWLAYVHESELMIDRYCENAEDAKKKLLDLRIKLNLHHVK